MKIRFVMLLVVCCLALSITAASAATVNLKLATMGSQGWFTTIRPDSSGRGDVQEKLAYGGEASGTFQFIEGKQSDVTQGWGAMSTANYSMIHATQITALNIRVGGIEGDDMSNWQPPHFQFAFRNNLDGYGGGVRYAEWIPWSDGTARQPLGNYLDAHWQTYNALVDGSWKFVDGGSFTTFAAFTAAYPAATFTPAPGTTPYPTYYGKSFNLGYADWMPGDTEIGNYNGGGRGLVDWFEVGIDGVNTKFMLNEVPEPGSLIALATGLIGFLGLRKRF